jgi:hypothetical protein
MSQGNMRIQECTARDHVTAAGWEISPYGDGWQASGRPDGWELSCHAVITYLDGWYSVQHVRQSFVIFEDRTQCPRRALEMITS